MDIDMDSMDSMDTLDTDKYTRYRTGNGSPYGDAPLPLQLGSLDRFFTYPVCRSTSAKAKTKAKESQRPRSRTPFVYWVTRAAPGYDETNQRRALAHENTITLRRVEVEWSRVETSRSGVTEELRVGGSRTSSNFAKRGHLCERTERRISVWLTGLTSSARRRQDKERSRDFSHVCAFATCKERTIAKKQRRVGPQPGPNSRVHSVRYLGEVDKLETLRPLGRNRARDILV